MHLQCLCCDWEDGVFLGSMHGSLGCNTNPTLIQFIRAYKRLLFGMQGDINAVKFNYLIADETTIADLSKIRNNPSNCDKVL